MKAKTSIKAGGPITINLRQSLRKGAAMKVKSNVKAGGNSWQV